MCLLVLISDATYAISEVKGPMAEPRLIFEDPQLLSFTEARVATCDSLTAYADVSMLHCRILAVTMVYVSRIYILSYCKNM